MFRLTTIKPNTWIALAGLLVVGGLLLLPFAFAFAEDGGFIDTGIKSFLYVVVVNLTGWLLWLGGTLLDYGVNTFVINFGTNFNTGGVGEAVDQLWVLVRDFFNILFIFGLVYIGFKMILNSDDSRTKSTLISLIMAALLINFSLFITKFVVDFSNTLASEVAIAGFDAGTPGDPAVLGGDPSTRIEIGDTFFRLMGIAGILDMSPGLADGTIAPYSYIFGIGIINIIGAFAFGVGGIMLIIRFVVLSIYMVLSPFMFLGWIFPGFQGMSSKYWSGFLKQSFYAPVYIVMIFFSATILNNFFGVGGSSVNGGLGNITGSNGGFIGSNVDGAITTASDFGGGFGPFILSAAFLIAAVQVAGKLSADGSSQMAKIGGAVQSRVRGAVRGGVRNTAGLASSYTVNRAGESGRRRLNNLTSSMAQSNRLGARTLARGLDSTAGAGLDRVASARIAGSETAAERRTRINTTQARFNTSATETQRATDLAEQRAALAAAEAAATSPASEAAKKEAKNKIKKLAGKMSTAELLNLDPAVLNSPEVLRGLSSAQKKAIGESGTLSNAEMKQFGQDREAAIFKEFEDVLKASTATTAELEGAIDELTKTLSGMNKDELSGISADRLSTQVIASRLTDKDLENIKDSGNLSASEFENVKTAHTAGLESIAKTGGIKDQTSPSEPGADPIKFANDQREKLAKGSAQDVGKLPASVFAEPKMAKYITPAALQQRVRNGLSAAEVNAIETSISNYCMGPGSSREADMWEKWSQNTTEGSRFNF